MRDNWFLPPMPVERHGQRTTGDAVEIERSPVVRPLVDRARAAAPARP